MDEKPEQTALVPVEQGSVASVLVRMRTINELMREAMTEHVDYGIIPGTGGKPTLLKPGAEKLCLLFRLCPHFTTIKTFAPDGHLTAETICEILTVNAEFLGDASALCSTRETKYAYRKAARKCPHCGAEAIIRGREEYGGGYVCWKKKGGCGLNFQAEHEIAEIEKQPEGRVPNEDIADQYNTVLRIAEKRALNAAVRLVTGCSAIFDEGEPEPEEKANGKNAKAESPLPRDHQVVTKELGQWQEWLDSQPTREALNEAMKHDWQPIKDQGLRQNIWRMALKYAENKGWRYDRHAPGFVPKEETAPK